MVSQSGCIILRSCQQCMRVPVSSHICQLWRVCVISASHVFYAFEYQSFFPFLPSPRIRNISHLRPSTVAIKWESAEALSFLQPFFIIIIDVVGLFMYLFLKIISYFQLQWAYIIVSVSGVHPMVRHYVA